MKLIQFKKQIAFVVTLCMVLGLFILPQAQEVYAADTFPQAAHAIDTYYNASQDKVLDDWEELAAVYAYLEGSTAGSYAGGVDISAYTLPATGTGAGGLFAALMKGDAQAATGLAQSLLSDGLVNDPGFIYTYALQVLALEAYNRSAGVIPVVYSTSAAIKHILDGQYLGGGYTALGSASYDNAGAALAVLSLPAFAGYPNIATEKADLIAWLKNEQAVSGAFQYWGSDSANSTAVVLFGLSVAGENLSSWTTSPAIGLVNANIYNDAQGWLSSDDKAWGAYATKQATLALIEVNNDTSFYQNIELNSIHYISTQMQLIKPDGTYVEKKVTIPTGSALNAAASIVSGSVITGGFDYYEGGTPVAAIADGSKILGISDHFENISYFSHNGSGLGVPIANVAFGASAEFNMKNLVVSTGAITSLPNVSIDVNADGMGDLVTDAEGDVSLSPIHPVTNLKALEFTYDYETFSNVRRIPTGAAILPGRIHMASSAAYAKTVSVRVEGPDSNVAYYSAYDVAGDGSKQLTAGDALTQVLDTAGKTYTYVGGYLSEVDGIFAGTYDSTPPSRYDGWVYFMNGAPGSGLGSQVISDGDEIVVYYGYYPGWGTDMVELSSAVSGGAVTLTIKNGLNKPVDGVRINWDGADLPEATDAQGQVVIDSVSPGTYPVQISKNDTYGVPQIIRLPAGSTVVVTATGGTTQGGGSGATETNKEVSLTVKGLNGATLLSKTGQTYYVGITARDVLNNSGLTISGNGNYVSAIEGLAEFDHGPGSGWLYTVNGTLYGSVAADDYSLDIDDSVVWYYTTDYTSDRNVKKSMEDQQLEEGALPETIIPEVVSVNGVADVAVSGVDIANAIQKAKEKVSSVIVIAPQVSGDARKVNVSIPASAISDMSDSPNMAFKIQTEIGSLSFSSQALSSIASEGGSTVDFSIEKVDKSGLSEEDQTLIGNRPVVSLSVLVDGQSVNDFGEGSVTVNLPYSLAEGEDPNAVVVYYVNADGELESVRGAYNKESGTVDFTVNHFSKYAIGYNKVAFSDVASSDWYSEAVNFLAAREITRGTKANMFSPNAKLTRGQFIVMLMKAYGIEALENSANNFADAGDTYYTSYMAAAKELEISKGVGNNKFAPDNQISRQDMFTLLYRALSVLKEAPEASIDNTLSAFSDRTEILDYAEPAMEAFVAKGIVSGSGGKLSPKALTTRAQMAQVLYNLLSQ